MAQLAEVLNGLRQAPKPRHKLVGVLEKLEQEDKEALEAALQDPTLPSAALARALRASGHPIGVSSVKRFRKDVLGMTNE